jgi:hypothetical protein
MMLRVNAVLDTSWSLFIHIIRSWEDVKQGSAAGDSRKEVEVKVEALG